MSKIKVYTGIACFIIAAGIFTHEVGAPLGITVVIMLVLLGAALLMSEI